MQRSAFDLDDAIVPARLEDLAVETRWPEEATDDFLVEFESIRDDHRGGASLPEHAKAVEFRNLEWVDCFNNKRLLTPIGYLPPVEYEQQYYCRQNTPVSAAGVNC